uniref:putative protein TPRXL n=1 Tax=Monopterus albus TaxID=43700 RepID=UPI0009B482B3|nr:putative protein TPRXL [Monopterus albus]
MKSSSSSSSVMSTSVTTTQEAQLLFSPSSPPLHLSLQSPELQAEFLREFQNKLLSHSDFSDSSVISSATSQSSPFSPSSPVSSPISPTFSSPPSSSSSSSSSPCYDSRQAYLSLSSPELLSELKESKTRSLRHVPAHNGMTTVFSGRGRRGGGRQVSGSSPSTQLANQKT